jgi:hypothetical protein
MDAEGSRARSSSLVLLAVVALLGVTAISSDAQATGESGPSGGMAGASLAIKARAVETGWVRVRVRGLRGSTVIVREQVGDAVEQLATVRLKRSTVLRRHALSWRCDRLVRRLVATSAAPNGGELEATAQVRTRPCKHRLKAYVRPIRPRAGSALTVRVIDRWRIGDIDATACLAEAGGTDACEDVRIAAGRAQAAPRFRVPSAGRWRLDVSTAWGQRLRRQVSVRGAGERLNLLATGDSMIQYVDTSLARRLEPGGDVSVRSDARISTGISKPFLLNWVTHARRQVASYRPDVTVVFIGANDGFPFRAGSRKVRCCGHAWIKAYARRARLMMASYSRRAAGQVYWLTLPAPRSGHWAPIYRAVNSALRRAAAPFGPEVRLIEMGKVFTPHGRFRTTMRWHGHRVVVRQGDGIHLSVAGASIAAELVQQALRADDVLG